MSPATNVVPPPESDSAASTAVSSSSSSSATGGVDDDVVCIENPNVAPCRFKVGDVVQILPHLFPDQVDDPHKSGGSVRVIDEGLWDQPWKPDDTVDVWDPGLKEYISAVVRAGPFMPNNVDQGADTTPSGSAAGGGGGGDANNSDTGNMCCPHQPPLYALSVAGQSDKQWFTVAATDMRKPLAQGRNWKVYDRVRLFLDYQYATRSFWSKSPFTS